MPAGRRPKKESRSSEIFPDAEKVSSPSSIPIGWKSRRPILKEGLKMAGGEQSKGVKASAPKLFALFTPDRTAGKLCKTPSSKIPLLLRRAYGEDEIFTISLSRRGRDRGRLREESKLEGKDVSRRKHRAKRESITAIKKWGQSSATKRREGDSKGLRSAPKSEGGIGQTGTLEKRAAVVNESDI